MFEQKGVARRASSSIGSCCKCAIGFGWTIAEERRKWRFKMAEEVACRTRMVTAPDGTEIPVPAGGLGLADGLVLIRDDADVQVHPRSENGYYVVLNNAESSNNEAQDLFVEFTVEGAITTLERLAVEAFTNLPQLAIRGLGLAAGILVSLTTSSRLTKEVFIRSTLDSGEPVTYCLLL
jgi:hypothetical protein